MTFQNTLEFAKELDSHDHLKEYRKEFYFPKVNGKQVIYFTGNSLGLLSTRAKKYVDDIMNDWQNLAVEGYFYAEKPWLFQLSLVYFKMPTILEDRNFPIRKG